MEELRLLEVEEDAKEEAAEQSLGNNATEEDKPSGFMLSQTMEEEQRGISSSSQEFYENTMKRLKNFMGHLQKRNDAQRKGIL